MKVLVTGAAGFIGFHLCERLLNEGLSVVGIDNLNDYYQVSLKEDRLKQLKSFKNFTFEKVSIADKEKLFSIFKKFEFDYVVNLAAQAGVRYSFSNPDVYIESNILGFQNVLEACRTFTIQHLLFASSSSVYGANTKMPFSVKDNVDHPVSLYAASKKANELIAHTYAQAFNIPITGLRFFTVYGPWGRPDMAIYKFTKSIVDGKPLDVYNYGKMKRDFTYIDDIIEVILRLLNKIPQPDPEWNGNNPNPSTSFGPYRIFNVGNSKPEELGNFIKEIENAIGKTAIINYLPMQAGEVVETYADLGNLVDIVDYHPSTEMKDGVKKFVAWYKSYYKIKS